MYNFNKQLPALCHLCVFEDLLIKGRQPRERGREIDRYKVEGAKTNTPSKTNTYKRLPIVNIM